MHSTPGPIPSLQSLYRSDFILGRAVRTLIFALVVAAGVRWAAPKAPSPDPAVDLSLDIAMGQWVPVGAVGVAVLAGLIVFLRYQRLKKILGEGLVVPATVEDLIVHGWREENSRGSTGSINAANNRHAYYAVLRYSVQGTERTIRVKMPNSGTAYGIVKGGQTELSVLPSAPGKPLIRAVYLWSARNGGRL